MSTTTQILFNSPALHSLKRDQLVKLCKIHSIKANGKNVDLVERLKTHAQSLPRDSPLSVAFRSEQEGGPPAQDGEEEEEEVQAPQEEKFNPRPSSQWELVMDSITEEAEDSSSQGTLSSLKSGATLTGEFGTGSSKSTTVGSSIRALASSFGLKRQATGSSTSTRALDTVSSKSSSKLLSSFPLPPPADELSKHSIPYDALPPPSLTDLQTDHFTFDTTDPTVVAANLNPTLGTAPLPGHTLRPGVPAPVNARLSLGLAPRTPSKQGPTTTIRLVSFGSLASAVPTATLPPAGDTPNLKPFETTFDLDLGSPLATPAFPKLYPALPASPPMDDTERRMSLEASMSVDHDEEEDEDVPMPGAFAFGEPSTPKTPMKPFVFGSPSPQPAPFNFSVKSPDPTTKAKLAAEVIEEMNRRVFGGAAPMTPPPVPRVIRPLGSAKKSTGEGKSGGGRFDKAHEQAFGKMESIADVAAKRQGLKRKSSAASVRVGFTAAEDQGRGKRVRVDEANGNAEPVSSVKPESAEPEEERTKEKSQKEKDAIRRKLEASRARRRSSAAAGGARRMSGRVSGAGVLTKPRPAPSRGRFGFFSGAAKLVQGVWGKKATPAAPPAPKPAVAATSSSSTKKVANAKPSTGLGKMAPPPVPSVASAKSKGAPAPSMRSVASTRSTSAGRSRSPLPPSFAPSTTSSKSTTSTASSARTRNSSIAGASSVGTRTSSAAGSMGTRSSFLRVGSLGTRGSTSSVNTPSSTVDSARKTASRPSSRLLAPTASSLAKMSGSGSPSPGPLPAVQEKQDAAVLDAITNTSAGPSTASSSGAGAGAAAPAKGKGKLQPARKPRISRSRVIAKLASQRVASGSSVTSAASVASSRKSLGGGRARSSLGVKVQRGSMGGIKNGPGVVLDAKKRARQSEYYARRKSRGVEPDAMNVDP